MGKIITSENLEQEIQRLKTNGQRLILAGGVFDIIHPGHLAFFEHAKKLDGELVVLLESDENVKRFKGANRPIHKQIDRAKVLANLSHISVVVLLPEMKTDREYFDLVKAIEPDIIAITHDDPIKSKKEKQAEIVNGKVVEVIDRLAEHSTSSLIKDLESEKQNP